MLHASHSCKVAHGEHGEHTQVSTRHSGPFAPLPGTQAHQAAQGSTPCSPSKQRRLFLEDKTEFVALAVAEHCCANQARPARRSAAQREHSVSTASVQRQPSASSAHPVRVPVPRRALRGSTGHQPLTNAHSCQQHHACTHRRRNHTTQAYQCRQTLSCTLRRPRS